LTEFNPHKRVTENKQRSKLKEKQHLHSRSLLFSSRKGTVPLSDMSEMFMMLPRNASVGGEEFDGFDNDEFASGAVWLGSVATCASRGTGLTVNVLTSHYRLLPTVGCNNFYLS
jgi:hypothetical protein